MFELEYQIILNVEVPDDWSYEKAREWADEDIELLASHIDAKEGDTELAIEEYNISVEEISHDIFNTFHEE